MIKPDRTLLAQGLEIPRLVTGLWQVADQERGGTLLDPVAADDDLARYAAAGFDAFDMADHYGSAEVITGELLASGAASRGVRAFTKWCPPPGPMTPEVVRAGVERSLKRMRTHRIMTEKLAELGASSKLNAEWEFIEMLHAEGRTAADQFIAEHGDDVGKRSSADIDVLLSES